MADAPEGDELKNIFTRKVGPLPVVAWAGIAVVVWYVVKKKQSATAASTTTPGAVGTDPAGNTGTIDSATGYVSGSPEDLAALGNASASGSSNTGTTTQPTYTDNASWSVAAINYLVALGVDAVSANGAISAYLDSQTLSTTQQAQVNEAIQALGAPPQPPSPGNTGSVTSPPAYGAGTSFAVNPPTGLVVTGTAGNAASVKWNAAQNARSYQITASAPGQTEILQTSSTPNTVLRGLNPRTTYTVAVQGEPADVGAGSATATYTTGYPLTGGNPPQPPSGPVLSSGS